MENSFKSQILSAKAVLVLIPQNPTLDEVAAALALYLSVKSEEGKNVAVTSSSPMTVEFNRLVGVNKVVSESGNKNLVIKFLDYEAKAIEKVSYDIDNGQFKLTVVPKSGVLAPTRDQVDISHSGISADLIVVVGGTNAQSFPTLSSSELQGVKIVHVGTSPITGVATQVISFDRPASSISEIIATLIKESGMKLEPDTASNLIAGIEEGSNHFTSPATSAETFALVAELMKSGGRRTLTEQINRESFPAGVIPGESIEQKETPQSWLEPKIYKGTSVS